MGPNQDGDPPPIRLDGTGGGTVTDVEVDRSRVGLAVAAGVAALMAAVVVVGLVTRSDDDSGVPDGEAAGSATTVPEPPRNTTEPFDPSDTTEPVVPDTTAPPEPRPEPTTTRPTSPGASSLMVDVDGLPNVRVVVANAVAIHVFDPIDGGWRTLPPIDGLESGRREIGAVAGGGLAIADREHVALLDADLAPRQVLDIETTRPLFSYSTGTRLLLLREDWAEPRGALRLFHIDAGAVHAVSTTLSWATLFDRPLLGPGGILVNTADGGIHEIDLAGGERRVAEGRLVGAGDDGYMVMRCETTTRCRLDRLDRNGEYVVSGPLTSPGFDLHVSPDLRFIYSGQEPSLQRHASGDRLTIGGIEPGWGITAWSPDSRWLAVGSESTLRLVDTQEWMIHEIEIPDGLFSLEPVGQASIAVLAPAPPPE